MSAQGRDAPAFQEYAASMLSALPFRRAKLSERGLLFTLRLELWVNERLPAEPSALAAILGVDATEAANLLPAIMSFFAIEKDEIRCPELDDYRAHLETRRFKLSEGGKHGAAITNAERKKRRKPKSGSAQGIPADAATPSGTPSPTPTGTTPASGRPLSTVQQSKAQSNPPLKGDLPTVDPWIESYERGSVKAHTEATADEYLQASRG